MVDVDTPPRFSRLPEPLVGALRELARTKRLLVALDFDGSQAQAAYLLEPEGDGTRLTWAFDTEHGKNPVSRWFGLMLDRWVGGDFARGLGKLKTVLESSAPDSGNG